MIKTLQLTNAAFISDAMRREQVQSPLPSQDFSALLLQKAENPALVAPTSELESIFARGAQTYGVPVNLLKAIAKAESNFNPRALSGAGAQGIMQLMPGTAAGLGVTDAFDPEQNIMGGAKYISQMLKQFDGDVTLALAAYNAGPGAVKKHGGVPPYPETQNYVKTVSRYMGQELTIPAMESGKTTLSAKTATGSNTSGFDILADMQSQQAISILSQLMTQLEERNQEESQHTIPL